MSETIKITVSAAPPAKDGSKSIRNSDHGHYQLVTALRDAMRRAMAGHQPLEGQHIRLVMHYYRANGRSDALNVINGVADIIQRRCHHESHACDVWVIDDDASIREFHYSEETGAIDSYSVTIEAV